MKKLLSLIIALTLLSTCLISTGLADAFTIHNGITFGMSEDEVKSIEAEKGFEIQERYLGNIILGLTKGDIPPFDNKIEELAGPDDQKYAKGSVAGYEGSEIYFNFNDNGLCSVVYHLGGSSDGRYSTLHDQLTKKYGESERSGKMVLDFPVEGISCMTMYNLFDYTASFLSRTISFEGFEQWIVPTDGGYAIIMLLSLVSPGSECFISYSYIAENDFQSYIQDKLDTQNEKNEQLNNDI